MKRFKGDSILLLASIIWGFAFSFQKSGMDFMGPFMFVGIRFILGSLVVIPFLLKKGIRINALRASSVLGVLLFAGVSFQQVGIIHTSAGKAGFITGLYVVFVPIVGRLYKLKTETSTYIGAFLAIIGLYLLSVRSGLRLEKGDILVFIGAVFWTFHVLYIDRFTEKHNPLELAFGQFLVCGVLGIVISIFIEDNTIIGIVSAWLPLLYTGILSSGIAYTLQVVGQKMVHPSHAAIILSLESLFAGIGGYIFLGEVMSSRELIGASLMLSGMIISGIKTHKKVFPR